MTKTESSSDKACLELKHISDFVCMGCGCLCDDVSLGLCAGALESFAPKCDLGLRWFQSSLVREPFNSLVGGVECSAIKSVEAACNHIEKARRVLFTGLEDCSIEAQQRIIELARRVGSVVRSASSDAASHAVARIGKVSATLGEAKLRSDVVVFWMCDPDASHPRHLERYSVHPKSDFLPRGRQDRKVLVAGTTTNQTRKIADTSLVVDSPREIELLQTLRALVKGVKLDRAESSASPAFRSTSSKPSRTNSRRPVTGHFFGLPGNMNPRRVSKYC